MRRFWSRFVFALVLATLGFADLANAQNYPNRPIRLIVPFAAGGGADGVARILAKRLSETLGQQVVVENRPGAAGNIAAEYVMNAAPDGYTLLQAGATSINMAVFENLKYDLLRDFTPVSMTAYYPYIVGVNAKLPIKTLQEYVAYAKSKPGELNYGSAGVGTAPHLVTENFNVTAGLKVTHVPYRGTALAMTDLLGGQLTILFGDPVTLLQQIRAGTVRGLAVTSPQRFPVVPELPTVAESGYPGFEGASWHGILVPAKTPPEIVKKLQTEIAAALRHPETVALMVNQGMQPVGDTSEEFAAFLKKDIEMWRKISARTGITIK
jgi:tripartite-type tricarboxylate transporter receptor subunit TctC